MPVNLLASGTEVAVPLSPKVRHLQGFSFLCQRCNKTWWTPAASLVCGEAYILRSKTIRQGDMQAVIETDPMRSCIQTFILLEMLLTGCLTEQAFDLIMT